MKRLLTIGTILTGALNANKSKSVNHLDVYEEQYKKNDLIKANNQLNYARMKAQKDIDYAMDLYDCFIPEETKYPNKCQKLTNLWKETIKEDKERRQENYKNLMIENNCAHPDKQNKDKCKRYKEYYNAEFDMSSTPYHFYSDIQECKKLEAKMHYLQQAVKQDIEKKNPIDDPSEEELENKLKTDGEEKKREKKKKNEQDSKFLQELERIEEKYRGLVDESSDLLDSYYASKVYNGELDKLMNKIIDRPNNKEIEKLMHELVDETDNRMLAVVKTDNGMLREVLSRIVDATEIEILIKLVNKMVNRTDNGKLKNLMNKIMNAHSQNSNFGKVYDETLKKLLPSYIKLMFNICHYQGYKTAYNSYAKKLERIINNSIQKIKKFETAKTKIDKLSPETRKKLLATSKLDLTLYTNDYNTTKDLISDMKNTSEIIEILCKQINENKKILEKIEYESLLSLETNIFNRGTATGTDEDKIKEISQQPATYNIGEPQHEL